MKFKKMDKILIAWIIIVLIAIAWPSPSIPEIDKIEYSDKIAHMLLFGVVTFLTNEALTRNGFRPMLAAITGLLAGTVYAGLAEIIQLFVPGRSCSLYDFYAGVLGSIIALTVIYYRRRRTLL
jgi:polysaccharide biosynthesis protein VpsQ